MTKEIVETSEEGGEGEAVSSKYHREFQIPEKKSRHDSTSMSKKHIHMRDYRMFFNFHRVSILQISIFVDFTF